VLLLIAFACCADRFRRGFFVLMGPGRMELVWRERVWGSRADPLIMDRLFVEKLLCVTASLCKSFSV